MTRKSINWGNQTEQKQYQDMGLHWMTNANGNSALERSDIINKDLKFWGNKKGDTKKNLDKLVNSGIPNYWRFHHEDITYSFNSLGFRAPEFDNIDWKNSYVILGCSHVMGIGNMEKETIGKYIEKELGHSVINLGVAGATMSVIYNNLLKLIKEYGKPKGVFILWTYPTRQTILENYYVFDNSTSHVTPFWDRKDIIPGYTKNKRIPIDDVYLNKCFYDRSLYLESTKQILYDIPLSMITDTNCWMLDCYIKGQDPNKDYPEIIIPVPEEFTKQLEGYNKTDPMGWAKTSDRCKEWYLNEINARDIDQYEKTGPGVSHWGRLVNKHIAKTLVKNLKK